MTDKHIYADHLPASPLITDVSRFTVFGIHNGVPVWVTKADMMAAEDGSTFVPNTVSFDPPYLCEPDKSYALRLVDGEQQFWEVDTGAARGTWGGFVYDDFEWVREAARRTE